MREPMPRNSMSESSSAPRATRRLATAQQMSFTNVFRGARGLSQPPIDDIETYWSPTEKAQVTRMLARSILGSPDTVRLGIEALLAETGADQLIVVSDVYEHSARLTSFLRAHRSCRRSRPRRLTALDQSLICLIRRGIAAIREPRGVR